MLLLMAAYPIHINNTDCLHWLKMKPIIGFVNDTKTGNNNQKQKKGPNDEKML